MRLAWRKDEGACEASDVRVEFSFLLKSIDRGPDSFGGDSSSDSMSFLRFPEVIGLMPSIALPLDPLGFGSTAGIRLSLGDGVGVGPVTETKGTAKPSPGGP